MKNSANRSELYSNVEKDNVLVTTSTSEGNMIAVNTFVDNGDQVVVQLPAFMQIPGLIEELIEKFDLRF